jgi:hypothetical protein
MRQIAVFGLLILSFTGATQAQDDARAIVAKAIKAQGGEEKLSQVRAGRSKLEGVLYSDGREIPIAGEDVFALPGQIKIKLTVNTTPRAMTIVEIVDGDKGWISIDGQVKEADADGLARMKQQLYLSRVIWLTPLLKDRDFELTPLKETKVADRALLGIKVASKGQKEINLYFDKESGLLARLEYPTKNNQGREVMQEDSFSDYIELGGIKIPKKSVAMQDGKKLMEVKVISAEFPESIPAKEFSKP